MITLATSKHHEHLLSFISRRALRHPVRSFACLLPDLLINTVIRSSKKPVGAAHRQIHSGSSRQACVLLSIERDRPLQAMRKEQDYVATKSLL